MPLESICRVPYRFSGHFPYQLSGHFPYRFSGHVIKGQGQTATQWLTLERILSLLFFVSQGQVQTTGFHPSNVHSIFYEPFA